MMEERTARKWLLVFAIALTLQAQPIQITPPHAGDVAIRVEQYNPTAPAFSSASVVTEWAQAKCGVVTEWA